MRYILLGYSFKPRPKSSAFGTAGSVMSIGLSMNMINGCPLLENQFAERKQD